MNGILRRRRALIAQGEPVIKIKDIPVGSKFRFSSESTTFFIYLGVINGTAWLLRDTVISTGVKMRNDGLADYENSNIDTYLSTTLITSSSQRVQDALADTTQTFKASDGTDLANKTITRKIFLLSYNNLYNNTDSVLSAMKKYYNTTSDGTARKAKDSGGTVRAYWTCSAYDTTKMYYIASGGTSSNKEPNFAGGTIYRRPVYSINKETPVKLIDGVYVMV